MSIEYPKHNYEAAYKKRRNGKLMWISCTATSQKEANKLMDAYVAKEYNNEGYIRYAGALPIKQPINN